MLSFNIGHCGWHLFGLEEEEERDCGRECDRESDGLRHTYTKTRVSASRYFCLAFWLWLDVGRCFRVVDVGHSA